MKNLGALLCLILATASWPAALPAQDFGAEIRAAAERIGKAAADAAERRQERQDWWKPLEERRQALQALRGRVEPSVLEVDRGDGGGTGFIIDPSGLVLTNAHVVNGVDEVTVQSDHVKPLKAKVVARAPERDVALLRIEGDRKDWPALKFADMSQVQRADPVYSFGNSGGYGIGIHEGLVQRCENDRANPYAVCIQSSNSIGQGDSGGPLVNHRGEVVGMSTMYPGGSRDVSWSVHADVLRKAVAEYRADGQLADYGIDAMFLQSMTPAGPVLIVRGRGPASPIGAGGVIEEVDGRPFTPGRDSLMAAFKRLLAAKGKDGKVSLKVLRRVRKDDGTIEEVRETVEVPLQKLDGRMELSTPHGFFVIPGS